MYCTSTYRTYHIVISSPQTQNTNNNDDMNIGNDKDTMDYEQVITEAEAASTLAELAGSGKMRREHPPMDACHSCNSNIVMPPPPIPAHDEKASALSLLTAEETSSMIKRTVLRKLNRPKDLVKRNMFAVEGKAVKFPLKVSLSLFLLCFSRLTVISYSHLMFVFSFPCLLSLLLTADFTDHLLLTTEAHVHS